MEKETLKDEAQRIKDEAHREEEPQLRCDECVAPAKYRLDFMDGNSDNYVYLCENHRTNNMSERKLK